MAHHRIVRAAHIRCLHSASLIQLFLYFLILTSTLLILPQAAHLASCAQRISELLASAARLWRAAAAKSLAGQKDDDEEDEEPQAEAAGESLNDILQYFAVPCTGVCKQ